MRRMLWVIALVLGGIGPIGWVGDARASAFNPSTAVSQEWNGAVVSMMATLLKDQPNGTAIVLTLNSDFVNLIRYDLEEVAVLRDGTGRIYPVAAVEELVSHEPHHRQAILRFAKIAPEATVIELIVMDVAGAKERIFRWDRAE